MIAANPSLLVGGGGGVRHVGLRPGNLSRYMGGEFGQVVDVECAQWCFSEIPEVELQCMVLGCNFRKIVNKLELGLDIVFLKSHHRQAHGIADAPEIPKSYTPDENDKRPVYLPKHTFKEDASVMGKDVVEDHCGQWGPEVESTCKHNPVVERDEVGTFLVCMRCDCRLSDSDNPSEAPTITQQSTPCRF